MSVITSVSVSVVIPDCLEMDCWIFEALSIARSKYDKPKLAVAMEYLLPSTDIGIAGYEDLGGITDYAIGEMDIPISAGMFPVSFLKSNYYFRFFSSNGSYSSASGNPKSRNHR